MLCARGRADVVAVSATTGRPGGARRREASLGPLRRVQCSFLTILSDICVSARTLVFTVATISVIRRP